MSQAVHDLLFRNFLQRRNGADVNVLAAQTLAVQFLEESWTAMERQKLELKKDTEKLPGYV